MRPKTPLLATDVIVRLEDYPGSPIVLIERKNPPYGWAIPGGFVDAGERVEAAAVREMREEISLEVSLELLLGLYSDPSRDPRGHIVTAVYIGKARGEPEAADDAKSTGIFTPENLPNTLAFDHALVLQDYCHYLETGEGAPLRYNY